jgi:polyisoprenoid-binding protein YceI
MKMWIALAAAAALVACQQPADKEDEAPAPVTVQAPSGEYTLDPHHSTMIVRVPHFGLSSYQLRFNGLSGALNFNAENPAQSTVQITVDATSPDTPYSGEIDFDAQLQNSEYLDSATYPTATFRSTNVEQTGPNTARVTGDLTIRNQTHPATFEVTYNGSWRQHPVGTPISGVGFTARGTINRADYGMSAQLPPAAEPQNGIGNEVELVFEAEFNRPLDQAPVPAPEGEPTN